MAKYQEDPEVVSRTRCPLTISQNSDGAPACARGLFLASIDTNPGRHEVNPMQCASSIRLVATRPTETRYLRKEDPCRFR